jgi:hypothetical protein
MPPVGFETTIPASARPQTYGLDRAATGISQVHNTHGHICLRNVISQPIPVAARSNACVYGPSVVRIAGSNPAEGMNVCLLRVSLSCQVKVSATGPALVHKSPPECRVSEYDRGNSQRRPRPTTAVEPCEKKSYWPSYAYESGHEKCMT